jgi:hypothetical protein
MEKMPAQYLPKLSRKHVDGLVIARDGINEVGQTIGTTNLGAKALLLATLARAYEAVNNVLETVDKRELSFKKRYHLLTPEEEAALSQPVTAPGEAAESPGEA